MDKSPLCNRYHGVERNYSFPNRNQGNLNQQTLQDIATKNSAETEKVTFLRHHIFLVETQTSTF